MVQNPPNSKNQTYIQWFFKNLINPKSCSKTNLNPNSIFHSILSTIWICWVLQSYAKFSWVFYWRHLIFCYPTKSVSRTRLSSSLAINQRSSSSIRDVMDVPLSCLDQTSQNTLLHFTSSSMNERLIDSK